MHLPFPVVLASGSSRRLELLRQIGIEPIVMALDIDESVRPGELAKDYVARLANKKAQMAQEKILMSESHSHPACIIAADTTVMLNGEILGKPIDAEDGVRMLMQLQNQSHYVLTAVCILYRTHWTQIFNLNTVWMGRISVDEAYQYWCTGEPQDKAGGYAIQGAAAKWIQHLEGSYSGVMGLPLYDVSQVLQNLASDDSVNPSDKSSNPIVLGMKPTNM